MRAWLASLLALSLAACAHAQAVLTPPSTVVVAPGQPAPPQARLYADCLAQAAARQTYDRESNWIRWHCDGAPAQAFFDGLGAYSATIGSELHLNGRTWRFTNKMQHDASGIDYCWRADSAGAYGCTIVLNVGEFLAAH